jgi:hypothetical protein
MKVNNIPLMSYKADDKEALLIFETQSKEDVEAVVSAEIVVLNSANAPVVYLNGYTIIDMISIAPQAGTITLRLLRQDIQVLQHEESLKNLGQENKVLKAQLEASIQSNQMLEDCIVEMAEIVYA